MTNTATAVAAEQSIDQQIFVTQAAIADVRLGAYETGAGHVPVSWYYQQPIDLDYDNTRECHSPGSCVAPITYVEGKIRGATNQLAPASTGLIHGPGTYLFVRRAGHSQMRYRLAVRRSDDYVGYITELLGVPFVYAPTYIDGMGHQTDAGLGADCVAVIVYGMRRAGKKIPYMAPPALYHYMHIVGDSTRINATRIRRGDVLHFGFQTAVISQDLPPLGQLSPNDRIIESYHQYVEEVQYGELPYRGMPFDVLRWNEPD